MLRRVVLPTLHEDQVRAYDTPGRYLAIRCGRRWGKTKLLNTISADAACRGEQIGWFVPEAKFRSEPFQELVDMLAPVKRRSSMTEGIVETIKLGKIDFWSLENELAGRGRHYHKVFIDEAAFTKSADRSGKSSSSSRSMIDMWERNIEPTLLDYQGEAIVASNTNGIDVENFLYAICNDEPVADWRGNGPPPGRRFGFVQYHAPTINNPLIPARLSGESDIDYLLRRQQVYDDLRKRTPPLVWRQEYEAEFVDWSGVAFFAIDRLLLPPVAGEQRGQPVDFPRNCETVYATIDSATKTGNDRDGTGVCYWALLPQILGTYQLVLLDWDLVQIEGALLETWLPGVFLRLEELAQLCNARYGSVGAHIEDKSSGMILLQQARRRGWMAEPIDSKLTSVGKSERAISVSGYVYREAVKLHRIAYDKVTTYKGTARNHLVAQVTGFRVGDKDQVDDDLLDCFTYGIAIGLGNDEGF